MQKIIAAEHIAKVETLYADAETYRLDALQERKYAHNDAAAEALDRKVELWSEQVAGYADYLLTLKV